MSIESFLLSDEHDPDWQFTSEEFLNKRFQMIESSGISLPKGKADSLTLRYSPMEKSLIARRIRMEANEGSVMDLTLIVDATDRIQQVHIFDVYVKTGANVRISLYANGGKLNKNILQIKMDTGSKVVVRGGVASRNGNTELVTRIEHRGDDCASTTDLYSVSYGTGRSVLVAGTFVEEESMDCSAASTTLGLNTGMESRFFGSPETISENATSILYSQNSSYLIPLDVIHYLQTRGLPEPMAHQMVIQAFWRESFHDEMTDSMREELIQLMS